jgi:enoyl reductase-like protein
LGAVAVRRIVARLVAGVDGAGLPASGAWRESGFGVHADIAELQDTIARLEQRTVDLSRDLKERQSELEAARAANRELTRALNHRG